jgi:hypothetical protein
MYGTMITSMPAPCRLSIRIVPLCASACILSLGAVRDPKIVINDYA